MTRVPETLRRSSFLRQCAGGVAAAALAPPSPRARASDLLEYTLTSAPLTFSPAPNVRFAGLAFNGTIPGPVLRAIHGQRVRIRYISRVDVPTTVHWHGMILPNEMDGVASVTQPAVPRGGEFLYEFVPNPPGTRWYHDHAFHFASLRGLYGMFIVEDPNEESADAEFALVFHDLPKMNSVEAALRGASDAPMREPLGSPEMREMMQATRMPTTIESPAMGRAMARKMGDEVAYVARCINGACYPATQRLGVKVGQRVRLRILNANFTETRYIRLAGHRLTVTHADGNPLARAVTVDALRVGVAERYDVWFDVTKPGSWLLQGLSNDPLAPEQAVVVNTSGYEHATPMSDPESITGIEYLTYQVAAGTAIGPPDFSGARLHDLTLGGGEWANARWTINGQVYPRTARVNVTRGDRIAVRFTNNTDMDHPMHLHGHVFDVVEVNGKTLARPLAKDTSLVPANGGTLAWRFTADSPAGRWLLHCHNEVHMAGGMMTEVVYGA